MGGAFTGTLFSAYDFKKILISTPLYGGSAVANYNKYIIFVLFGSYMISKIIVYIQEKIILKLNYGNE